MRADYQLVLTVKSTLLITDILIAYMPIGHHAKRTAPECLILQIVPDQQVTVSGLGSAGLSKYINWK